MGDKNNLRQNDGRKNNKRQGRVKIIKNTGQVSLPMVNKAKKNRAEKLSNKAISNIFGSEDGIWDKLAENAMDGNMKAMEMLMQYRYGKAGENKEAPPQQLKAPIISFNVAAPEQTIDVGHKEEDNEQD